MPELRGIQLPQRRHTTNGKHILDMFSNWRNPAGMKLLMGLLTYNPDRRLTADDALKSSYFSSMVCSTLSRSKYKSLSVTP